MRKKVIILGSTGSIGSQTLEVIRSNPNLFEVEALSCNRNLDLFRQQIEEFKPKMTAVAEEKDIVKMIQKSEAEIAVVAISGAKGLVPTIEAIKAGKNIALATKEVMVLAGELITKELKTKNQKLKSKGKPQIKLVPIDSEHNAIWQCLRSGKKNELEKIILTCSGGPFRDWTNEQMKNVNPEQALNHPNWTMGKRITIDCATLLNKGLEIIEAKWLFNVNIEQIEVVVHPESVIHSAVEFKDGSIIAQLGPKDMRLPIQYALTYPKRIVNNFKKINLIELKNLSFYKPDLDKFPCLKYAIEAGAAEGTMPTVLNAADEIAVELFLNKKIKFLEISKIINHALEKHKNILNPSIEQILKVDQEARKEILSSFG